MQTGERLWREGRAPCGSCLTLDLFGPVRAPCSLAQLAKENALPLKHVRFFVLDECDKMLEKLGERRGLAWLATPALQ